MKHTYIFASALLFSAVAMQSVQARDVSQSTPVETRLEYLQKMLQSRSGERLVYQGGGDAYSNVIDYLGQAHDALEKGDRAGADTLAKEGLKLFMEAVRRLPEADEEVQRWHRRYDDMRKGLENLGSAQQNNHDLLLKAEGEGAVKEYDHQAVDQLIGAADQLAAGGHYEEAVLKLSQAQAQVTRSIQAMMNNRTLVIELDLSTPEKEYAYELRRYQGYEPLIEVAIDVKKPNDYIAGKMRQSGEKAIWMAGQARNKAEVGDYPVAIRMMMDATDVLRNALKLVGVMM